ncbi:MAG TPA: alpha/beta fold hydrolase [Anaerolineaceae bacterium]
MEFLFWVAIVIGGLILAFSYYISRVVIYPRVRSVEETHKMELEGDKMSDAEFDSWEKEEVRIRSPYGYDLYGLYLPIPGSKWTVIIAHGITYSLYGSVKYVNLFRKRGCNVLLYEHRNHGRSGGKNTTFGLYEKYDLKAVVDWALARLGEGGKVGTHGESMGAAITLQHAAIDPRVQFVIADCPYESVAAQVAYRLKAEYHLPYFPLIPLASLFAGIQSGMFFGKVSPLREVARITCPVFFIHGANDDYIPPQHSIRMHNAKKQGISRLWLAPNARHAESQPANRLEYDQKVGDFLKEVGVV